MVTAYQFHFIQLLEDERVLESGTKLRDCISSPCRPEIADSFNLKTSIFNAFKEI
jgi:hypothetical protein